MSGNSRRDGQGGRCELVSQSSTDNDLKLFFFVIGWGKKELVVRRDDKMNKTIIQLQEHFNIPNDKELFVVYKGIVLDTNTTFSENGILETKTINVVIKDRPHLEPVRQPEIPVEHEAILEEVTDIDYGSTNFDNDTFVENINFLLSSGFEYEDIVDSLNKSGNDVDLALVSLLDKKNKQISHEIPNSNIAIPISNSSEKKANEFNKIRNLPIINDLKIKYQREKNFENIVSSTIDMFPQYLDLITANLDDFKSILCEPSDKTNEIPFQDDTSSSVNDIMKAWDSFPEEVRKQLMEKQSIPIDYLMSFTDSPTKNDTLHDCFTLQEEDVINRLVSMFGVERGNVVDAFLRNGKDYDQTANYLIDHLH